MGDPVKKSEIEAQGHSSFTPYLRKQSHRDGGQAKNNPDYDGSQHICHDNGYLWPFI